MNGRSAAGKKGALAFWRRFRRDADFRTAMLRAWRQQKHDRDKTIRAAKLGGIALWRKYHLDPDFRRQLDIKLRKSRSKGGAVSLKNLGEVGFKARLLRGLKRIKPVYIDSQGNRLRSSLELRVAGILGRHGISYEVEPRFVVREHAFNPDFVGRKSSKIVEVVGFQGDTNWDRTAAKIKLLVKAESDMQVLVATSLLKTMARRLAGLPRVKLVSPYEEDELVRWCRGDSRGTQRARRQSGLLRGP